MASGMNEFNCWRDLVHKNAKEKGFYDGTPRPTKEAIACSIANLHSEVSELWEAFREGKLNELCGKQVAVHWERPEDAKLKPVQLTCLEEELADIIIRALDTAGFMGVDIQRAIEIKHTYNTMRPKRHGGKLA